MPTYSPDRIYTIYRACNSINGKSYVGFDSNWPTRMNNHRTNHLNEKLPCFQTAFHRALRKYGFSNFEWSVLYQSKDREHAMEIAEPHFIELYQGLSLGYNSTRGGEVHFGGRGSKGHKCSDEHKRRLSLLHRTRPRKPHSDETRRKISENRRTGVAWNSGVTGDKYKEMIPHASCVECSKVMMIQYINRHRCA